MNLVDCFLQIGSTFDYISPLAVVFQDLFNGPAHTFLIPYDSCPLSGRDINILLNRREIKNWGHIVVAGTLMVNVCQDDARQAEQALKNHGVPLENAEAPATASVPRR